MHKYKKPVLHMALAIASVCAAWYLLKTQSRDMDSFGPMIIPLAVVPLVLVATFLFARAVQETIDIFRGRGR